MISQLEVEIQREAERVTLAQGVELYWLEVRTSGPRWQVTVYIDRAGGVTLDDCERVSRALEAPLDALIDHSYELEVSSPGIDRSLHTPAHYRKALGKPVELRLRERKTLQGWLHGISEDAIVLTDAQGMMVQVPFAEIAQARVIESRFL
ncbi:MAG: ribosome maturation factor RimP [Candidatus Bipolaricaulota bacterium]|nr:ribosome maturation factor RimP [Candidatus Bipolaricaulota bacterium]